MKIWKHENMEHSKEAGEQVVDTIRYDTRWGTTAVNPASLLLGSLSIVGVKKKVENKRQRKNRLPLNNLRSMSNIKNTIAKPLKVSNTKTNTL